MDDTVLVLGFAKGLRPEPRMTVSQWADSFRYLSSTSSAEPGLYRTERTPYMRKIVDSLSANETIWEVIFMKAAQTGGSEGGFNWLGYIIDLVPAPTMIVQPTDALSKRNSKMRIDPMIDATPRLREKISPQRSRDSGNTMLQKEFPGGVVVLSGANSAVGLRSMPVRNLFLDEVDAYPQDLDGEGSPVDLAKARTRTFARKKIFLVSTPTVKHTSVIEAEYLDSDQQKYYVPCPHCHHMQELVFENLKWDDDDPDSVLYFCEGCGVGIEDRHKGFMLKEKGYGGMAEWRATNLEHKDPKKIGFHISSLYSPYGWYSWADVIRDYIKAEGNPTKMKTFRNTVLGLTYEEDGEVPAWENLYNRREQYKINQPSKECMFITVGVDVQKDRLELEIVGWCRGKRTYSADFRVLMGDTAASPVWDDLAKVVNETWEREDGMLMPMQKMAIDTGYNTQHVYNFCARFDGSKVVPIKGMQNQQLMVTPPRQVNITQAGKKIGKTKLWHVGVSMAKSELYGWLRQEVAEDGTVPKGYCHYPEYDQHFFRGLTAETLELRKNKKGYNEYVWIKKYDRNEPLDCRVYARAAAYMVGIDRHDESDRFWNQFQGPSIQKNTEEKKAKRRRDSSFWGD